MEQTDKSDRLYISCRGIHRYCCPFVYFFVVLVINTKTISYWKKQTSTRILQNTLLCTITLQ